MRVTILGFPWNNGKPMFFFANSRREHGQNNFRKQIIRIFFSPNVIKSNVGPRERSFFRGPCGILHQRFTSEIMIFYLRQAETNFQNLFCYSIQAKCLSV